MDRAAARSEDGRPHGILFDQYSRYAACAESVEALSPGGGTVLDVGSGRPRLLGRFLPAHDVVYVDPGLEVAAPDAIVGDVFSSELDGRMFDVVTSVDTLEHVPPARRSEFLGRLRALARRGVVLAAPFDDGGAAEALDRHVNDIYRARTGREYPWLKEHAEFGLPDLASTEAALSAPAEVDWHLTRFGNGRICWLDELLVPHVLLLDGDGRHTAFLEAVGARFSEELYRFDHLEPVYRQVLVAWCGNAPELPRRADDESVRREADQAWAAFRDDYAVRLATHVDELTAETDDLRDRLGEMQRASSKRLDFLETELARTQYEAEETLATREADWQRERRQLQSRLQKAREKLSRRGLGGKLLGGMLHGAQSAANRIGLRGEFKWKVKSGFFAALYPIVRHTQEYREFCEVRDWRRRAASVEPVKGLDGVAEADPQHDDVVVFGIIDWHFRIQRPQHLAREFANLGHRVFFVSPRFVDHPEPGFAVAPIEDAPGVWEVRLHATGAPVIYHGPPAGESREVLIESLRAWMAHVRIASTRVVLEHPSWFQVARHVPRSVQIYDCMDNHDGFATSGADLGKFEDLLVRQSDGLVVTSDWLEREVRPRRGPAPLALVRNGCEPAHFLPLTMPVDEVRCIGYFGAIAEWFDAELVAEVARMFPECRVLLVGNDTADVGARMAGLRNVEMTGEIPYRELPDYLEQIDVCLIPFVIDDLTRATNPVKAYEALAAGRPVVATPMPELMTPEFAGLVHVAERGEAFVAAVRKALAEARDPERVEARREFARSHSWLERARAFDRFAGTLGRPSVSVVVVSWNDVELTRRCVRSVLDDPAAPELDVVVVDNASTDGTGAWLDEIEQDRRVRVIRNRDNRGFARACNQGLEAARGDWLVILNNDLVVTRGWLRTLVGHFRRDAKIGLLGPVTNNIGNEARVPTAYGSIDEMHREAARLTAARAYREFDIAVLAFFCVMMPRAVFDEVGGLDEGFEVGFFEDDDYCRRVREAGYRVACAEDVFVHHELSASFEKLDRTERDAIFARNKAYFESKWGEWTPHRYRPEAAATKS